MTKEKIVIILKYDVLYYNLEAKIWKALVETGSKAYDGEKADLPILTVDTDEWNCMTRGRKSLEGTVFGICR